MVEHVTNFPGLSLQGRLDIVEIGPLQLGKSVEFCCEVLRSSAAAS